MRILVVDDIASMRHFVAMSLAPLPGPEVVHAADGATALDRIERGIFAAIILDMQLPDMDGWNILTQLRQAEDHARHIPVLAIGTHADAPSKKRAEDLGAQLISQPVSAAGVRQAIQHMLELSAVEEDGEALGRRDLPVRVTLADSDLGELQATQCNALGGFVVSDAVARVGGRGTIELLFSRRGGKDMSLAFRIVHVRRKSTGESMPLGFALSFQPQGDAEGATLGAAFSAWATGHISPRRAALRRIPVFSGLEPSDFERLEEIVTEVSVAAGETIVGEGDSSKAFFILKSGTVRIEKGEQEQLALLSTGDFFGEMGVLLNSPRSASVIAVEDTDLFRISRPDLMRLLRQNPQVAGKVQQTMIERYARNVEAAFSEG